MELGGEHIDAAAVIRQAVADLNVAERGGGVVHINRTARVVEIALRPLLPGGVAVTEHQPGERRLDHDGIAVVIHPFFVEDVENAARAGRVEDGRVDIRVRVFPIVVGVQPVGHVVVGGVAVVAALDGQGFRDEAHLRLTQARRHTGIGAPGHFDQVAFQRRVDGDLERAARVQIVATEVATAITAAGRDIANA